VQLIQEQIQQLNDQVSRDLVDQGTISRLIDDKVSFSKGEFVNREQFNTMSEVFSEQFREFKEEVVEMVRARPAPEASGQPNRPPAEPSVSTFELDLVKKDVKEVRESVEKKVTQGLKSIDQKMQDLETRLQKLKQEQ
jgi:hypothetical protein